MHAVQIPHIYRCSTSRKVESLLGKELEEKPKLCMMKQMTELGIECGDNTTLILFNLFDNVFPVFLFHFGNV